MREPVRLRNILVPLDGSGLAECALPPAIELARKTDGVVTLLHAPVYTEAQIPASIEYNMYWPGLRDNALYFQQVRAEAEEYLKNVAKRSIYEGVHFRLRVLEGDRAEVIIDAAVEEDADLIIMTTHGRTGLSRWVMGSVSKRVLHGATCPVLIIRSAQGCRPDQRLADPFARILVPLDGSALAEEALGPALTLARELDGKMFLLHVSEEHGYEVGENASASGAAGEAAAGYLAGIVDECRAIQVAADPVILKVSGDGPSRIAGAILDYAAANRISLIAMSTHGRTGLKRWFYGSIAERVLHASPCAMLVIRSSAV